MPNIDSCGDGKNRLDARTYRAIQMAKFNKTAEKRSFNISQDSDNDLHAEGSRKSDSGCASCEPSCKRQRVGLTTQRQICSCDGVVAPSQQIFPQSKDAYSLELAKSPQMDGSPVRKEEGDEGENVGAKEDGEIVDAEENGIDASHDQSPSVSQGSPNAHLAGLNDLRFREYWVPVQLSNVQLEQYCSALLTNSWSLCSSAKRGILNHLNDVLSALSKCCDHPYVLDPTLVSFSIERSPLVDYSTIGIQASGKLQLLRKLLPQIREQGLRVLIVYKTINNPMKNSIGIGHILDDFICQSFGQESYVHIYSQSCVPQKEKQTAVDLFNDKTNGKFVVLTEYKSSRVSIRLSSVDVVILFNSDWNPVNDIRALQKMKIHTESDHVRVFRLYSVCTQEEKTLGLARDTVKTTNPSVNMSTCHLLLAWGAANLFDKLDALHAINTSDSESTQSLESEFLSKIIHELSTILSSKVDDPSISCSLISEVGEVGRGYSGNVKLHGELEVRSLDDVPLNVFWSSLLDDRSPRWRFLPDESESMERRIPLCEKLSEMSEGGLLETGVLHKELPRWSRGRSNAKRSLRSRRSTWRMGLSTVDSDISELIQQVEEAHQARMRELATKQSREILEYFKDKNETREAMDKIYGLQKDLICELGESLSKLDKLKELDDQFKIKLEVHKHEMDKRFVNLQAAHRMEKTSEEEMRLKRIDSLKKRVASTMPEDSDGARVNAPSTSPTVISNPVAPLQEPSPRGSLKMVTDNVLPLDVIDVSPDSPPLSLVIIDISPDSSPMEDSMAISVDPDKFPDEVLLAEAVRSGSSSVEQSVTLDAPITSDNPKILRCKLGTSTLKDSQEQVPKDLSVTESQDPGKSVQESQDANDGVGQLDIEDVEVSLCSWTFEKVILTSDHNQVSQGLLSSSVPIADSQSLKESVQCTSNCVVPGSDFDILHESLPTEEMTVAVGSDIEQINVTSVSVPVDEPMDVLSAPVTPDILSTSDCSPFPESELGANILKKNENEAVTVAVGSDIEQINVTSVPVPVDEPMDVLSAPVTPDILNTSDCSPFPESELGANILKKNENEAQRLSDGVSTGGSSPCVALLGGEHPSVNQDTTVEDLRQQTQANTPADLCSSGFFSFTMPQLNCTNQSRQLPLDQLPTKPLCTEISVTDGSLSLPSSSQYVENGACSQLPTTQSLCTENSVTDGLLSLPSSSQYVRNGDCSQPFQTPASGSSSLPSSQYVGNDACSQLPTTQSLCAEISVTDGLLSLPSSSQYAGNGACSQPFQTSASGSSFFPLSQYVGNGAHSQPLQSSTRASLLSPDMCGLFDASSVQTDNQLMLHQTARWTQERSLPHLSSTTRNYYPSNSRNSDVRANSHQTFSWDPLQIELERIQKEHDEVIKKRGDTVVQLQAARDQEIAQISQKYALLFQDGNIDFKKKKEELNVYYQKTKAQKLLAETWAQKFVDDSPTDDIMFQPSSLIGLPLANGMQSGASALPRQFPNRLSTDQFIRSPNPPLYHSFCNSEGGWGPVPNPYLRPSLPAASIPFNRPPLSQLNQHTLNPGSYSQLYNFGDYQFPYNGPI